MGQLHGRSPSGSRYPMSPRLAVGSRPAGSARGWGLKPTKTVPAESARLEGSGSGVLILAAECNAPRPIPPSPDIDEANHAIAHRSYCFVGDPVVRDTSKGQGTGPPESLRRPGTTTRPEGRVLTGRERRSRRDGTIISAFDSLLMVLTNRRSRTRGRALVRCCLSVLPQFSIDRRAGIGHTKDDHVRLSRRG